MELDQYYILRKCLHFERKMQADTPHVHILALRWHLDFIKEVESRTFPSLLKQYQTLHGLFHPLTCLSRPIFTPKLQANYSSA